MPTPGPSVADAFDEALRAGAAGDEARPLLDILQSPPQSYDRGLVSEALCALAAATADPRLRPHLLAERDRFLDDPVDEWPAGLPAALTKYGEPLRDQHADSDHRFRVRSMARSRA